MADYKLDTERLTECRKKLGISKNEAAKRVGVSQPAYLRYESGERTPSMQVIKEMAALFATSPDYLTGKKNSPEADTYVINSTEDPELFLLIQKYKSCEKNQLLRLLAYLDHFNEELTPAEYKAQFTANKE